MSDQGKYQVVVEQVAKGDGAKQVAADVNKLADAAGRLRGANGRFLPKDATPEMIDAAKAAKAAGESASGSSSGWTKLYSMLGLTREQFKQVREAARAAGGPIGQLAGLGSMGASTAAVVAWTEAYQALLKVGAAWDDQLKKLNVDTDAHNELVAKTEKTIAAAKSSALNDLEIRLAHLHDHYDALAIVLKQSLAAIEAHAAAANTAAADWAAAADAAIAYAVATGKISEQTGAVERANVALAAEKAKAAAEDKKGFQEEQEKAGRATAAEKESADAEAKLKGLTTGAKAGNTAQLETAKSRLTEAQKIHSDATAAYEAAKTKADFIRDNGIALYNAMHPSDMTTTSKAQGDVKWAAKAMYDTDTTAQEATVKRLEEEGKKIEADIKAAEDLANARRELAEQLRQEIAASKQHREDTRAADKDHFTQESMRIIRTANEGAENRPVGFAGEGERGMQFEISQAIGAMDTANTTGFTNIRFMKSVLDWLKRHHAQTKEDQAAQDEAIKELQAMITARGPRS